MTTATIQRDKQVIDVLEKVIKLYRGAIDMELEKKQRIILQYIEGAVKGHEELATVGIQEACQQVLEAYPKGMPHDQTLIEEAMERAEYPYKNIFPRTSFEEDILIYKMFDLLIKDLFDSIPKGEFNRVEQMWIQNLWGCVHNTLVENPNFKGNNPYYKRHYGQMVMAKKSWLELLDKDYQNIIDYFKEKVE